MAMGFRVPATFLSISIHTSNYGILHTLSPPWHQVCTWSTDEINTHKKTLKQNQSKARLSSTKLKSQNSGKQILEF